MIFIVKGNKIHAKRNVLLLDVQRKALFFIENMKNLFSETMIFPQIMSLSFDDVIFLYIKLMAIQCQQLY